MHTMKDPVQAQEFRTGDPVSPIFIKDRRQWIRLRLEHVEWVEAADNCTILHLNGDDHIVGRTLKDVMAHLTGHGFERIHRSYAINLRHIDAIDDGGVRIGPARLPIGRKYRSALLAKLQMI